MYRALHIFIHPSLDSGRAAEKSVPYFREQKHSCKGVQGLSPEYYVPENKSRQYTKLPSLTESVIQKQDKSYLRFLDDL